MMVKEGPWCGYCGTQDFRIFPDPNYPKDPGRSTWECKTCEAEFKLNHGYGYYTNHWGKDENRDKPEPYSLGTGQLLDKTKLPRTPEGIVRHSSSREELEAYLARTQIQ